MDTPPVVTEESVLAGAFYCLDADSGEVRWQKDYATKPDHIAVSSGRVCVVRGQTRVYTAVDNEPPTPAFSIVQGSNREYHFNASESTDADGQIEEYEWDFTSDGTYEATGEVVTHTFESPGEYTVTLRVTDDRGVSATTQKPVSVS